MPIVGNLFDLKKLVEKFGSHGAAWCQLANKYGPVVGLRLGFGNPLIIISGYNAVMEMLNRREFDGRPNGFIFSHRTHGKKRGVIFTDGQTWTEQKRQQNKNKKISNFYQTIFTFIVFFFIQGFL